jgi:hypothetical protein
MRTSLWLTPSQTTKRQKQSATPVCSRKSILLAVAVVVVAAAVAVVLTVAE